MNTEPQIEAVTDDDLLLAVTVMQTRLFADGPEKMTGDFGETLRYILGRDRRRVAERQAARDAMLPRDTSAEQIELLRDEIERLRAEVAAHRKHDVLRCDALMKAEAEVAKLNAACAAKDGVIIRFLNAPLAQRDGTPVPSLLLASARAALSDTTGAGWIDATGAVEVDIVLCHANDPDGHSEMLDPPLFPAEWAGSPVVIVRKP